MPDFRVGQRLAESGRYSQIQFLGEGGMARIYRARDKSRDGELVVLKLPRDIFITHEDHMNRFKREIQIHKTLSLKKKLPNIPQFYYENHISKVAYNIADSGKVYVEKTYLSPHDGSIEQIPFMVMEYLEGEDLQSVIDNNGPYPLEAAVQIIHETGNIIKAIHNYRDEDITSPIVYRDLKPENLYIDDSGRVILFDFGIAKCDSLTACTLQTSTIGTVHYMAPEQIKADTDEQAVDPRADVYGLVATFYTLITGEPPFTGDGVVTIIKKVLDKPPISPKVFVPDLPESVERCILRGLIKDRDKRYQTVDEFLDTLDRAMDGEYIELPKDSYELKPKPKHYGEPKSKKGFLLAGTAVFAVALILLSLWQSGRWPNGPPGKYDFFSIVKDIPDVTDRTPLTVKGKYTPETEVVVTNARDAEGQEYTGKSDLNGVLVIADIKLFERENNLSFFRIDGTPLGTITVKLDTIPQELQGLKGIPKITNQTPFTFNGRYVPGKTIGVTNDRDKESRTFTGTSNSSGKLVINDIELSEGENNLEFFLMVNGAIGPSVGTPQIVILDTTAPEPPVLKDIPRTVEKPEFLVKATAEPGSFPRLIVYVDAGDEYVKDGEEIHLREDGDGRFSCRMSLSNGEYEIAAATRDVAGNDSKPGKRYPLTVDINRPDSPYDLEANDVSSLGGNLYTTNGSANVEIKGKVTGGNKVEVLVWPLPREGEKKKTFSGGKITYNDDDSFIANIVIFANKRNAIQARAYYESKRDLTSEFSQSIHIIHDSKRPEAVKLRNIPAHTNSKNFVIEGIAEPSCSLFFKVNKGQPVLGKCDPGGNCTVVLTLKEGINHISVKAKDLVGNQGIETEYAITLDTTPPIPLSIQSIDNCVKIGDGYGTSREKNNGKDTIVVTGRTEPGVDVKVSSSSSSTHVKVDDDGSIEIECPLEEGENKFAFTPVDRAGNAAETTKLIVVFDNTRPAIEMKPIADVTNKRNIILAGRTESGATVVLSGNNISQKNLETDREGRFKVSVGLRDGLNRFKIIPVDRLGNRGDRDICETTADFNPPDNPRLSRMPSKVSKSSLDISGQTESGSIVHIVVEDGREYRKTYKIGRLGTSNGSFKKRIELIRGENTVSLWAEDRVGNASDIDKYEVTYRIGSEKPSIDIDYFPTQVEQAILAIKGTTDTGIHVYCEIKNDNGTQKRDTSEIYRKSFQLNVGLAPGKNEITLWAEDEAGRTSDRLDPTVDYMPGPSNPPETIKGTFNNPIKLKRKDADQVTEVLPRGVKEHWWLIELNDIGELIIEFRNPTDNSMLFDIHKCKSDSNNADGHEMQRRPMRRATRSFEPERPKHFEMFKIKVYSKLGEDHGNCRYTLYRYINTAITPGD